MHEECAKFTPYETRTSVIKVISYDQKQLKGILVNPYYEKELYFDSVIQLIFLVDQMLDALNYPQRGMETRNFRKDDAKETPRVFEARPAPADAPILASFKLNILFRQNASWQGSIVWLDKAMESQFRSLLELIALMDSVLCD